MRTVEDERRWLENRLEPGSEGHEYPLLIMYQDSLVGSIGLHDLNFPNHSCEIGYWLIEEAQARVIVTRACRALVSVRLRTRPRPVT